MFLPTDKAAERNGSGGVFRPHLRLREGREGGLSGPGAQTKQALQDEKERAIVCGACGFGITSAEAICSKGGSRTHTFFNPAGIVYEILCVTNAPGCRVIGAASTEFSWFSGYAWRVVVCGDCRVHLGWLFESGSESFFGLIRTKLRGDL